MLLATTPDYYNIGTEYGDFNLLQVGRIYALVAKLWF